MRIWASLWFVTLSLYTFFSPNWADAQTTLMCGETQARFISGSAIGKGTYWGPKHTYISHAKLLAKFDCRDKAQQEFYNGIKEAMTYECLPTSSGQTCSKVAMTEGDDSIHYSSFTCTKKKGLDGKTISATCTVECSIGPILYTFGCGTIDMFK